MSVVEPGTTRSNLTDREQEILELLLPEQANNAAARCRDHRQVINGTASVKRTGAPWAAMPTRCGPAQTAYNRS